MLLVAFVIWLKVLSPQPYNVPFVHSATACCDPALTSVTLQGMDENTVALAVEFASGPRRLPSPKETTEPLEYRISSAEAPAATTRLTVPSAVVFTMLPSANCTGNEKYGTSAAATPACPREL